MLQILRIYIYTQNIQILSGIFYSNPNLKNFISSKLNIILLSLIFFNVISTVYLFRKTFLNQSLSTYFLQENTLTEYFLQGLKRNYW